MMQNAPPGFQGLAHQSGWMTKDNFLLLRCAALCTPHQKFQRQHGHPNPGQIKIIIFV
jgi:hypothetical protein